MVNFAVNPSQPAGDYDLYLKVAPGTDYSGFDSCFAKDVPTRRRTCSQRRNVRSHWVLHGPLWTSRLGKYSVLGRDRHRRPGIPPAELSFMAKRAQSQITYVKAGHLSMIAQPWAVANVINRAVWSTSSVVSGVVSPAEAPAPLR